MKSFSFKFFFLLLCWGAAANAALADASGTTGDCSWQLTSNSTGYTLTISGKGKMADCEAAVSPWYQGGGTPKTPITALVIAEGVTYIGAYAFDNCEFTSVTIPASVTAIGTCAFWYCSELSTIYCNATTPPTLPINAFYSGKGTISNVNIVVPASAESAYRNTSPWSSAKTINGSASLPAPTSDCFSFRSSATYTGSSLSANVTSTCSGMASNTALTSKPPRTAPET